MSKVRIRVCLNENRKIEKPIIIDRKAKLQVLLKQLGNKLNVKAKRLFTQYGSELDEDSIINIVGSYSFQFMGFILTCHLI